jgi:tetratricopeptide (TPR) repeat protein
MVMTVWLVLRWWDRLGQKGNDNLLLLVVYIISLSVGIHLGTALVVPAIGLLVLAVNWRALINPRFLSWAVFLAALGISVHLFLLLRSNLDPAINEAAPKDWDSLWLVLKRDQYKPVSVFLRKAEFSFQLGMYWRYFVDQFSIGSGLAGIPKVVPIALGVVGLVDHFFKEKRTFVMLFVLYLVCSLGLIVYLNFSDHEVRERDYFYTASFHFFAIWIGLGMVSLAIPALDAIQSWRKGAAGYAPPGIAAVIVIVSLLPFFHHHHMRDARGNYLARDYAYNMLASLEPNAVVFTNGDNDTFPLWYIQEVEGVRKDVRVANLSLIQTDWYMKQLRDIEPTAPISMNDKQIAAMRPRMDPETGRIYSLKDIAVQNILSTNNWERPMYLAVTVPDHMGLDDQLVMEGLVFRIEREATAFKVDTAMIRKNLYETFMYRGLLTGDREFDYSVYKDANALKLIQNYAAAHARLAFEYRRQGKLDEAIKELEEARKFRPYGIGVKIALGALYGEAGRFDEAEDHFRAMLEVYPNDHELHFRLGDVLLEKERVEEAVSEFRRSIAIKRDYFYPYGRLFAVYWQSGLRQEAVSMLRDWLRIRPDDDRIRAFYQAYRESLQVQGGNLR